MDSLWVEEPVDTSWSKFCSVNHRALASNYQLFNSEMLIFLCEVHLVRSKKDLKITDTMG